MHMQADQSGGHPAVPHTPGRDRWDGKIVLVAGATRGFGYAAASRLADMGATVMLLPRAPDQVARVGRNFPDRVVRLPAMDLSGTADVLRAIAPILDFGGVDMLINVAAPLEPIQRCADVETALERVFHLNVVVPADLSTSLYPLMVQRGWGRIVNVSAGLRGEQTSAGSEAYVAARHALEAHTRNLAARLLGTGVTANVYRPGAVAPGPQVVHRRRRTGSTSLHWRVVSYAHLGRFPRAQEAMPLLRLLRSDQTGKIWAADG